MTASDRPPNQVLQALDPAAFALIEPHLATIDMVRATAVGVEGAPLRHVYFPHRGSISITVTLGEGQTIAVAMLGRDSLIGGGAALTDGIALAAAMVLCPGTASVLDGAAFRSIVETNGRFRRMAIRHEQALLAQAQQSLLCNTFHPVEARLARWLLRARDICENETLPLTQELLAHMIGVRRNAVSLVAHALQRAGVIHYSRGQIVIADPGALQTTSCGCHGAVKAYYAQLQGLEP